jgi:hypothetical protein
VPRFDLGWLISGLWPSSAGFRRNFDVLHHLAPGYILIAGLWK